ncbi:hypothetical protein FRC08_000224 [Ceratobasidium sp. 394]|nr:hypothetical protein FRC08_000224 [Ceratobasidium sp. 394]
MPHRRQQEEDEDEGQADRPQQQNRQSKRQMREDIRTLQNRLLRRDEKIGQMREDIEVLRRRLEDRPVANPGHPHADGAQPQLSRSEMKTWMQHARVAGRRAAALHEPFPNIDALGDQQVQAHLEEILADVQKAKDGGGGLDDENNPALYFNIPRFSAAGPVEMAREMIFHLPKSPGKAWLEEWFLDSLRLGARKQRGDLAHSIVEDYEKIFDIHDPRFEDRATRREIPEVQDLLDTFMHTNADDPLDTFFRHTSIVRVLRLLLNRPSAIRAGRRSAKARKPHASMWHIKSITPSLLAFAATMIRFVLSGEPSFEEASGPTNYTKWYRNHLRLIKSLYIVHPCDFDQLIDDYNHEVFPNHYRDDQEVVNHEQDGEDDDEDGLEELNAEERAFLERMYEERDDD